VTAINQAYSRKIKYQFWLFSFTCSGHRHLWRKNELYA